MLPAGSTKTTTETFSVLQEKLDCVKFFVLYRKSNFSLALLMWLGAQLYKSFST
jgi:hypothetical protein